MADRRQHAAGICGGAERMAKQASQRHRRCATLAALAALVLVALAPERGMAGPIEPQPPGSYLDQTLLRFDGGAGGGLSGAPLIMDASGNLYGTTSSGGSAGYGAVFELTPNLSRTAWTETVLYNFCTTNCDDGRNPYSGLIMDDSGNLYGTTLYGGSGNGGVAFELTPPVLPSTTWTYNLLYTFCSQSKCADGNHPSYRSGGGGLLMDASGNLYGTTIQGGPTGNGVLFELTPNQSRTVWTESVLWNFCSQTNCADGATPNGGLIMDGSGNLYGTTAAGGSDCGYDTNCTGVVFELTPATPPATTWTYALLHNFSCPVSGVCVDGISSAAPLVMDAAGNLYGTTTEGGLANVGLVFELTPPSQSGAGWSESLLYSFAGADGANPYGGLLFGCGRIWSSQQATARCNRATLIGTTYYGGRYGGGTVFELTPNASGTVWRESALYNFCSQPHCPNGENPYPGVIADGLGNLYGTTFQGGYRTNGVVFKLVPPGSPLPRSAAAPSATLSTFGTPLNEPRQ